MSNDAYDFLTLNFIHDFQCLGTDCSDHCCKKWNIVIGRESYQRLETVYPKELLELRINFGVDNGLPEDFGLIRLNDKGECPFFDTSDHLCSIHKQYGESYLSQSCRTYPRLVTLFPNRIELGLSLSCPEAVRLCLQSDAISIEGERVSEEMSRLEGMGFISAGRSASLYVRYSDVIRNIVFRLLDQNEYEFSNRVFHIYCFMNEISAYLYDGVESVSENMLVEVIGKYCDDAFVSEIKSRFEGTRRGRIEFSLSVVQRLILACAVKHDMSSDLIDAVFKNYKTESEQHMQPEKGDSNIEHLIALFDDVSSVYLLRRDRLRSYFGKRIDKYLENFCKNYFFGQPLTLKVSPLAYFQDLIIILAAIKFLFYSHSGLNSMVVNNDAMDESSLESAMQETIYKFSRSLEHSGDLLGKIHEDICRQKVDSLLHFAELIQF